MPTSLVTGGAGFLGSHVAEHLLKMGDHVVVLDDLSGGFVRNVSDGCDFYCGSILDRDLLERLFNYFAFDYVYHLAAYAAEGLSHFIKRFNYTNNLIGSVNLINCAVNYHVECFVFTSSIAVYGEQEPPFTEAMPRIPEDSYGIAKAAVERELEISHKMWGLPYVIFRPHNVYGERQNIGDKYRNVVGIFMNQCLKGEPMTIFGDGEQIRAFTYVSDVAPLIAACVDVHAAYNESFNVGSGTQVTLNQLAKFVADAMGCEPKVRYLDERNEVKYAFCDHRKLTWAPTPMPINFGLERMAAWVKQHGARESKEFQHIEIRGNMPNSWRGK